MPTGMIQIRSRHVTGDALTQDVVAQDGAP